MKLIKRLSDIPEGLTSFSRGGKRCPDIWETDTGDYVIIGEDVTNVVKENLPENADLSNTEQAVLIPRSVLQSAKKRI